MNPNSNENTRFPILLMLDNELSISPVGVVNLLSENMVITKNPIHKINTKINKIYISGTFPVLSLEPAENISEPDGNPPL